MSHDETERFSALVGKIYDATLDPTLWIPALEKIVDYVGGDTGVLTSRGVSERVASAAYIFNGEESWARAYDRTYIKLDPTYIGFNLAPIGGAISTTDVLPYAEFVKTRFYREFAKPQGYVDSIGILVDRGPASATVLCVVRGARFGLADEASKRRARLVAPHLRRAVTIGREIAFQSARAEDFSHKLDAVGAGYFLVDADSRVLHVNGAGVAMLDGRLPLRVVRGRLRGSRPAASERLRQAFSAAAHGDLAIGERGLAIPLVAENGDRFAANVLPLTSGARQAGGFGRAAAAMIVTRAGIDAPTLPQLLSRAFKLTPSELRVLLAIVEIGGVPDVATALGVARTTVRWHLKTVFAKTGAARQADLVKLVAGYASPLNG